MAGWMADAFDDWCVCGSSDAERYCSPAALHAPSGGAGGWPLSLSIN